MRSSLEAMDYKQFEALRNEWFQSSYQVWHVEGNFKNTIVAEI